MRRLWYRLQNCVRSQAACEVMLIVSEPMDRAHLNTFVATKDANESALVSTVCVASPVAERTKVPEQ